MRNEVAFVQDQAGVYSAFVCMTSRHHSKPLGLDEWAGIECCLKITHYEFPLDIPLRSGKLCEGLVKMICYSEFLIPLYF